MEGGGDNHELQLNLGLSLNGRFGVDPSRKDLKRSSSISDLPDAGSSTDNGRGRDARAVEFNSHAPLVRAASLPPDTEEWRRRKALHMAQCVEARRKRLEKMRNVRAANDINNNNININNNNGNNNIIINNNNGNKVHGNVNGGENGVEVIKSGITMPAPRRAFGYLKIKGSSGNANLNNQFMGGAIQNAQSRQFVIREPVQRPSGQLVIREPVPRPTGQLAIHEPIPRPAGQLVIREPIPRPAGQLVIREPVPRPAGQLVIREPVPGPAINPPERDERQQHNNALYSMPMVSTNGPNNTTIEGFLYKYNMREAIKIVCVCHGDFLTPAEFVKHATGRDVENPLQHILVTPYRIE